ncbi:MAG: ABC transporter permease subunit [Catenulispora sp.]|nr:ABC transporter permease subunit [Catenulispora sp.]
MPSTWWSLIAAIIVTIGGGAAMSALVHADTADGLARLAMSGVLLGQAVVAALGAAAIGDEYANGLIVTTVAAVPQRGSLLAAKAVVLGGTVLAATIIAASASLSWAVLLTIDAPDPQPDTAIQTVLKTAASMALIALLALGTATVFRSTATATGLVLGLLYLPPLLAALIADPAWQVRVQRYAPMSGVLTPIGNGTGREPASWSSVGVVATWAVAALGAGCHSLKRRDV